MGITEPNMASLASGMAAVGKIPFISSYAMFFLRARMGADKNDYLLQSKMLKSLIF